MRLILRVILLATLLLLVIQTRSASAAPLTDPNDSRTWQGANIDTFRVRLGLASNQAVIDAQLLDDAVYPKTADYAATFTRPGAPCGSSPGGLVSSTYVGDVQGCSGTSTDPAGYTSTCTSTSLADYAARAHCLDLWWVQAGGDGEPASGHVWDLGAASNRVVIFPIAEKGTLPEEALDYTVYLSNNPHAVTVGSLGDTAWVAASLEKVYLEGWISTWVADAFTTVWRLPGGQTYRYVKVIPGGPAALQHDGFDEIDAVLGLDANGEPACPSPSQDARFVAPTPECGSMLQASVGAPLTFTIAAFDPDEGDRVVLSVNGLPIGATLTPTLPDTANSVSTEFNWTPALADIGDHALVFRVVSDCSATQECAITVHVTDNLPPDCSAAVAVDGELWPPNHRLVPVAIEGVSDPDGDPVTVTVIGVTQDEAITGEGSGSTCYDAVIHDGVAQVRAERSGNGNGRVYHVTFLASDDRGGTCEGTVLICVPHDRGHGGACVDDGTFYTSLDTCSVKDDKDAEDDGPQLRVVQASAGVAQIAYSLPVEGDMTLAVYDVVGRKVATIAQGHQPAGEGTVTWTAANPVPTVYFVQLRVGQKAVAKRIFFSSR